MTLWPAVTVHHHQMAPLTPPPSRPKDKPMTTWPHAVLLIFARLLFHGCVVVLAVGDLMWLGRRTCTLPSGRHVIGRAVHISVTTAARHNLHRQHSLYLLLAVISNQSRIIINYDIIIKLSRHFYFLLFRKFKLRDLLLQHYYIGSRRTI